MLVAAAVLAGAACSSESGDSSDEGAAGETTTTAEATTTTLGVTTVEVTAADYGFSGVPEAIAAGSTVSLTTAEGGEPHELLAVRLADDETRTADELAALPEAEFNGLFSADSVAALVIALPGTTDDPGVEVGDGTLTEPGRYLFVCTFPQGTTVAEVEAATGPLPGDDKHYTLGMFAETTVE
ncbi:MAG TPA: hypothetical protein PKA98_03670 [Acidimicrobiales bacterium]|nr:hypothetical protein [Acidimicrobiales bacterium]